ncbi:MAG: arginase family protein [Pseudomonadota bacterium]
MDSPSLVVYRGRAGDRNPRGMAGAQLLGSAIARRFGFATTFVSSAQPVLSTTRWDEQLAAARADLQAFAGTYAGLLNGGQRIVATMGRCAAGLATVPEVARRHPAACVVWFDAHGDSNLPTSNEVPYLGGMVITGAAGHWDSGLGAGLDLANVVLVGARDLDPHEKSLIASGRLKLVDAGPRLAERLGAAVGQRDVYVHLDCDVLEPGIVPIEYEVPDGLTLADLHACATALATRKVIGVEIAEFECAWLDGRTASPDRLLDAIAPLLS